MSSNDHTPVTPNNQPSAAVDVSFSRLSDRNGERNGESTSAASSLRQSYRINGGRKEEPVVSAASSGSSRKGKERKHDSGGHHRSRTSGGFLLESMIGNGSPQEGTSGGKRKVQDGHLHVEKRRLGGGSRLSADSSVGGSPLSREVSMNMDTNVDGAAERSSRPPSMDPAQLVQMALELSESRRRHVSGTLQVPLPASPGSRRVSALKSSLGTAKLRTSDKRASYLSDEHQQESPPHNMPDEDSKRAREVSNGLQDAGADFTTQVFSPATLSRAEKARKYFELASEHRRLLQQLPPLKPDATAPGNFTYVCTGSPGNAHSHLTRMPSYANEKYELDRPYNPLQALRNRRLRARERKALSAPPEAWQDVESVSEWIDGVEAATKGASYRATADRVQLPAYPGDDESLLDVRENAKGHRRTDTVTSVITRPENGWSIEPPELLADTYWTERGDNKAALENRRGTLLFPPGNRASFENTTRGEGVNPTIIEHGDDRGNGQEDVSFLKRAHRGPHLLPRRHKRPARLTRSASTSSASSDEGRGHAGTSYRGEVGDLNIGPLDRHMKQMIAKDERGELSSPELVSPDRWDSRHTHFPILRGSLDRPRESVSHANGRLSVDTARASHGRSKSADGRIGIDAHAMSSMDDVNMSSAEQASPVMPGFVVSTSAEPSPTSSQMPSVKQQPSRLRRLPIFRAHSKERQNIDRTDFATDDVARISSLEPSASTVEPRSSMESARPSFISRHKTTESFSSSLRRSGTGNTSSATNGSIKEPSSSVGRFLKGGRIGELVRHESSRLGDRFRSKDRFEETPRLSSASEQSEDDDSIDPRGGRPAIVTNDADGRQRRASSLDQAVKYNTLNLPTFRSPAGRTNISGSAEHPISRQQTAQRAAGKSARFEQLAPPRINLPNDDSGSLPWQFQPNKSDTFLNEKRKSYGFLDTGSRGASQGSSISWSQAGNGPNDHMGKGSGVGLSKAQAQGHRHWSISNRAPLEQDTRISMRDVARVRALLLSSGVKSREIHQKANSPRDPPLPMIQKAADYVDQELGSLPRREEHLWASRVLSEHLSSTLTAFEKSIQSFHEDTARTLDARLDELQRRAADQLTKLVHDTSDDADAFTVELTTKQPQDIKRVDDAIDGILRQRRRQFRMLRRVAFKLLEWLVLGLLWWVWFIVYMFNSFRRVLVGLLMFLRWLFTF